MGEMTREQFLARKARDGAWFKAGNLSRHQRDQIFGKKRTRVGKSNGGRRKEEKTEGREAR